ncbi:MAG: hypothetical protein WCO18_00470 [bacterium]
MKNKIFFLMCLVILSGTIIFLPKEASAHSDWKCWPVAVTYDNGTTTYNFRVCGWTKSGVGNEEKSVATNPALAYAIYFSPAPCGNVTVQLLSATADVHNPPVVTPDTGSGTTGGGTTGTTNTGTNGGNPTPPCVPSYSCSSGKVINLCDNSVVKDCSAYGLICSNSGGCTNTGGVTIDPLTQNNDGTTKGVISIKSFVTSPNTINPYDVNNPTTTGKCNFTWTLNQYDSNSRCTVYDSTGVSKASYGPITALSSTYTATGIKNETTYKLSCAESSTDPVSGVTTTTSTSTKYATCNINSNYTETNQ